MKPIEVVAETASRGPLQFGPGTSWAPAKLTEFTIKPSGAVEGLGGMSAYLQGSAKNKAMCPYILMHVNYLTAGSFAVEVDQTTPDGARLEITLDGKPAAAMNFGPFPPPPWLGNRPTAKSASRCDARITDFTGRAYDSPRRHRAGLGSYQQICSDALCSGFGRSCQGWKEAWPCCGFTIARRLTARRWWEDFVYRDWRGGCTMLPGWTRVGQVTSQTSMTATGDQPLNVDTPPIDNDIAAWISRADQNTGPR